MKATLFILLAVSLGLNISQRLHIDSLNKRMENMADTEQVIGLAREVERQCVIKAQARMRFEMGSVCT